jgi:hypothetical protein
LNNFLAISFDLKHFSFFSKKIHPKFQNPTTTPSGRKVTQAKRRERERERRRKNVNSGHLVP